jgi:RimJ/RimL family protein N-acetyltransferase
MSDFSLPILRGERVTLPRPDDFEARVRLGTDAEIFRLYGGSRDRMQPMTDEAARRWVQRLLDLDYAWIIEVGDLIGHIRLDRVCLIDQRASLAIGIEDRARLGSGLGTEAIGLVSREENAKLPSSMGFGTTT